LQTSASGQLGENQEQAQNGSRNPEELASNSGQQQGESNSSQRGQGQQPGQQAGQGQQPGEGQQSAQADGASSPSDGNRGDNQNGGNPRLPQGARNGGRGGANRDRGYASAGGDEGGDISGSLGRDWNRLFDEQSTPFTGPITGDDFGPWSDRLRDVEEMVDVPELRNSIAVARERARLARQEYTRERKKPDWAVVQLQVMKPLLEVRAQIADELARRQSSDALVPIDRDPVPNRYSDLVRRYYEELGKDR
jgi:hypothetical protein